jgi:hypothetical protein
MKAGDDAVEDQGRVALDRHQASVRKAWSSGAGRTPADPLFKRFAIPREWRVKDVGGGS